MNIRVKVLAAACLASAFGIGCSHDKGSNAGMSDNGNSMSSGSSSDMKKPLEGNPGATTNQSVGYPKSDPGVYHPQTDDTQQYHPANPSSVQPK